MEFDAIVKSRYACKKFDGRKVDKTKMDHLFDLIRFSASSYGLQPWRIKVVTDDATKAALTPAAYNQPQIATCSHLLVICADTDLENLTKDMAAEMRKEGVPEENVKGFSGMLDGFVKRMDAPSRKTWAQKQCYIAMGNALNGAKSLGLDSCPMEGFDPAQYSKILGLPAHLVPTVLVPVGYPADTPRKKIRFSNERVFF